MSTQTNLKNQFLKAVKNLTISLNILEPDLSGHIRSQTDCPDNRISGQMSHFILMNGNSVEPHLSGPKLSRLFTYPDTCLGTNPHSSIESVSFIRNGGVRISEACLYIV